MSRDKTMQMLSMTRPMRLAMHVAVQAARHSLETLGEQLDEPGRVPNKEYPAFSGIVLDAGACTHREAEGHQAAMHELQQAARLLLTFHLAESITVAYKPFVRCLPHIEEFMGYLV